MKNNCGHALCLILLHRNWVWSEIKFTCDSFHPNNSPTKFEKWRECDKMRWQQQKKPSIVLISISDSFYADCFSSLLFMNLLLFETRRSVAIVWLCLYLVSYLSSKFPFSQNETNSISISFWSHFFRLWISVGRIFPPIRSIYSFQYLEILWFVSQLRFHALPPSKNHAKHSNPFRWIALSCQDT